AAAGQGPAQPFEEERIVVRDEDFRWQLSHDRGLTASAGPAGRVVRKLADYIDLRQGRRDEESLPHAGGTATPHRSASRCSRLGGRGGRQAPVAAGEHDRGGPPGRPVAARAERGDGGRTRIFDEQLAAGEECVGGGGDRVVVDGDDVVDEPAGVGEGAVAGPDRGEAVRDGGPRLDGDGPAGVE